MIAAQTAAEGWQALGRGAAVVLLRSFIARRAVIFACGE